jgi:3',5'-cyclic AMP phosphodiesterase CpdA
VGVVSAPFALVQLSDPHLGAEWGVGDPPAGLAAAVGAVQRLELELGAIVVTGDLTDHGEAAEYAAAQELTAPLGAPLHVLPGNHDERAAIRRAFDLPGSGAEPVGYTAAAGPLRLVALDTTIPGEDEGELGPERLAWLAAELAAEPEAPTVLAMHHPPLATGIAAMDDFALHEDDRRALGELLTGHPQVVRVIAGHLHLAIAATIGGRPLVVAPSTFVQARLDFTAGRMSFGTEPPGFVLHVWRDGTLTSHVQAAR